MLRDIQECAQTGGKPLPLLAHAMSICFKVSSCRIGGSVVKR